MRQRKQLSNFPQETVLKSKKALIDEATKLHGSILPCGRAADIDECFTITDDDRIFLWYNTPHDKTTHVVSAILFSEDQPPPTASDAGSKPRH